VDEKYLLVNRDDVVDKIIDWLSQGPGARILIKSAPFSGKTSILQMVLRKIRDIFEVVFIAGSGHSRENSVELQTRITASINKAQDNPNRKQVLIAIDDCHRLYKDDIIPNILKNIRSAHLLAAASYIIRNSGDEASDTPAVFQKFIDSDEVGISREQCLHLLDQEPFRGVIVGELLECLLSQCQLGNKTPNQKFHLGVFKHFLLEFAQRNRLHHELTAHVCYDILWAVDLPARNWMRRAFEYCESEASIWKNEMVLSFLRKLLLPHEHLNLNEYINEITILTRATVLYKVEELGNGEAEVLLEATHVTYKLFFSVEVAKRFVTRIVFPAFFSNGLYIVPQSIDLFIRDFLSSISADELQVMSSDSKTSSPNEYQWQQICYKRLYDLLGPQYPVIVEKPAADIGASSGRMDVYLPTLKWVLEYVQNASPANATEHHKRLERHGKYFTADTDSYRVIDFRGNSQGKFKAVDFEDEDRRSHHVTVWVSAEGNMSIETPSMERDSLPFVSIDQVVTASKKRKKNIDTA
jgi:hypothetical protein